MCVEREKKKDTLAPRFIDLRWCSSFCVRSDVRQLSSNVSTFSPKILFFGTCKTCLNTCKLMQQFVHASRASSSQLNKPFHQIFSINLMVFNHWLISTYLEKSQQKFSQSTFKTNIKMQELTQNSTLMFIKSTFGCTSWRRRSSTIKNWSIQC